jgi:hypothetical protein
LLLGIGVPASITFLLLWKTILTPGYVEAVDFFFGPDVSVIIKNLQAGWNWYPSAPSGTWIILYASMFVKYYLLGFSADLSEKLGLAEGYFFSGVFMYAGMRLAIQRIRPELAYYLGCSISSVFYIVNRLAITSIHFFAYGYASLPLVLGSYIMTTRQEKNGLLNSFIVALALSLAFSHATFLATSLFLVLTYQLFRFMSARAYLTQDIRKLASILIIFTALNSYWILPMLVPYFGGFSTISYGDLRTISYDDFLGLRKSIGAILVLNNNWLGIYSQDFLIGLGLPLAGLLAVPLSRVWKFEQRNVVLFYGIDFLLTLLLAVRDQPIANALFTLYVALPFNGLTWAFLRNPQWFYYVIAYCLSFLGGITVILFASKILGLPRLQEQGTTIGPSLQPLRSKLRITKHVRVALIITLAILGLVAPLFAYTRYPLSGNLNNAYEPVLFPQAYKDVARFLDSQPGTFRVWWLPVSVDGTMEFDWQASQTFVFPTPYLSDQPYLEGTNNLSTKFLVHLYAQELLGNSTHNLGKILAPLGVKFVVLHEDLRRDQTSLYLAGNPYANSEEKKAQQVLEEQRDLRLVFHEDFWSTNIYNQTRPSRMLVFENTYQIPYAYASDPLLLIGGLRSTTNLFEIAQFNPFEHSVILSENLAPSQLRNLLREADTIVFGANKTIADLTLGLENTGIINPGQYTTRTKPDQFWSVMSDGLLFFYIRQFSQKLAAPYPLEGDYLYGGVGAVTSARNTSLTFSMPVANTDTYDVWVRSLRSPIGGNFSLQLDHQPLKVFQTESTLTHLNWEKAGTATLAKGEHSFSLTNIQGSNLVNAITVAPSSEVAETQQWVTNLLAYKNVFTLVADSGNHPVLWNTASNTSAAPSALKVSEPPAEFVSMNMIRAGEYRIQIHASRPFFITLSEVFNPGWTTVEIASIQAPAFGLLNGFYLDKVGVYDITLRYGFNAYYDIGIWPSLGALIVVPLTISRRRLSSKARLVRAALIKLFRETV